MYIKYIDYLSPKITFYYKGYLSHSSILSGIISIIAIIFVIILIIYFSLDIIQRKSPNTSYFKTFTRDAGIYKINKTSLFHFINIIKNYRGKPIHEEFDFSYFNIIGSRLYLQNYLSSTSSKLGASIIDHWLYGYCDKKLNTEGIDDLITYDFFEKSVCIQKYYSCNEKKYFDIGDPNFVWPEIAHGTFNESNLIYGFYIQKCNNETIKQLFGEDAVCKSEEEIKQYFESFEGSRTMNLYFVNNYINVLDYKKPNNQFFYRIETPLSYSQYTLNDININPALIQTHNGLILDHMKEEISYVFDRNDVYTDVNDNANINIFIGYCFFLKNIQEYYERSYKRIQEVISNIGGINQAITIIAIYINYLYNNYVVLSDTEALIHSSIHIEKNIHKKKSIQYKNIRNKIKDIEKKNKNHDKNKSEKVGNKTSSDKKDENNIDISRSKNNLTNAEINGKDNFHFKQKFHFNSFLDKIDTINAVSKNYKNKDTSFLNYIYYMVTFKHQKKLFNIYENFRTKIMSEEHLIKNHLNIYNILKILEKKRHIRRYSYQLKNLIQML